MGKRMLEVFFCNVGDGDAALLTEHRDAAPDYTVLVDTGRPCVDPREGSLRKDAVDYLLDRNVDHLDRMILTHPHIDHVGGALSILREIPVKRIEMLTVPPPDALRVPCSRTSSVKPYNSLRQILNVLREISQTARERGTEVAESVSGEQQLTEALRMTTYLPRPEVARRQKEVCGALYRGETVDEAMCVRVAKERNLSSLMLSFAYAGLNVLITGDRYAWDWEAENIPPCHILKVPHHGDSKAMTEPLIRKLGPWFAVISCENDPLARKERPCEETVAMLHRHVPLVICTENRDMPSLKARTCNGIRFDIAPDGAVEWSEE